MTTITFHIKLASDMQARLYAGYSRIEPRVVIPEAFGGIDLIERDRDGGES